MFTFYSDGPDGNPGTIQFKISEDKENWRDMGFILFPDGLTLDASMKITERGMESNGIKNMKYDSWIVADFWQQIENSEFNMSYVHALIEKDIDSGKFAQDISDLYRIELIIGFG